MKVEKRVLRIDASECISLIEGIATFKAEHAFDSWVYKDMLFESGKIYGLIGEYQQGPMYLSYLMGGQIDFGDLKIYCDNSEITRKDLAMMSWNLEPLHEKYRKAVVRKSIEKAIRENQCEEDFDTIAEKFVLTEPRYDRKLFQLSGERWRASAALGYASGKKIFYAPYRPSVFYYQMCQSGLLKVLKELVMSGAIVFLPVGSDEFMKCIADECVYIKKEYDIGRLRDRYQELWGKGFCKMDWR